jgi:CHAT domain
MESVDLMTEQMRFIVRIDSNWQVSFACEQDPGWSVDPRQLPGGVAALGKIGDKERGFFPAPIVALHLAHTPHEGLEAGGDVAAIDDRYRAILARAADRDTIETFGHYLFDVLLGPDLWAEMQQKAESLKVRCLELALSWPDDLNLHRLNWELMRSDDGFLAVGTRKLAVAITRLVETQDVDAPVQLNVPPRVLFVVGTSLVEKEIRPGAELLGLLKQARQGRAMRYRVLEQASPKLLRKVVQTFKPEIVHFICHGGINPDDGRPYLDLKTDEEDAETERYADALFYDLGSGTSLPAIVVLSACLTAGPSDAERYVLAAGHETAPMATTLVRKGIPIVLGMAGRVADITCRVFARKFGEAIIKGESLVVASAEARQLAFAEGRDPLTTADWAFPAMFMAQTVAADYTPVKHRPSDDLWRTIEGWITAYNLPRDPVFCGREEFMQKFHQLFETPGLSNEDRFADEGPKRTLVAFVGTTDVGHGRTRLLQELASHAFRGGNLPLLLTFDTQDCPKDLGQLVLRFERAISTVRNEVLELGVARTSQLAFLSGGARDTSGLDPVLADELRIAQEQLTARAVKLAVRMDLETLLRDARAKYPLFAEGQVVVLLDDVDRYGPLVPLLFKQTGGILDASGLGSSSQPVPVVATCSLGGDASETLLKPIAEGQTRLSWLETGWLLPFQDTGEDLLAYELVLLNPFAEHLLPGVSGVGWAFNDDVEDDVRTRWEGRFRRTVRGIPQRFNTDAFYLLADTGKDAGFTIEADDEKLFQQMPRSE